MGFPSKLHCCGDMQVKWESFAKAFLLMQVSLHQSQRWALTSRQHWPNTASASSCGRSTVLVYARFKCFCGSACLAGR
jgi:hypothetical protein